MQIETFQLERNQSLFDMTVEINLSESGVHPLSLRQLLTATELEELLNLPLGYGFTEGTPASRDAVAAWHPGACRDNVLLSTGASGANLIALMSVADPGDPIVVILPNFMQLPGLARAFGMNVRGVPLDQGRGWKLDRAALRTAAADARVITLCVPNNPTGTLLDDDDRRFLVEVTESTGAWLIVDEIYRGSELEGRPETPTFWGSTARVIVTGGLAKSFAQGGARIGWVVAPKDIAYECMRRQDYTTIGTNTVGQFLCEKLLPEHRRRIVFERGRAILNGNLAILRRWLSEKPRGLQLTLPQAGGMAFLGYPQPLSSTIFCERFRQEENVLVVAGDWFGLEGRIRLGIGVEAPVLEEGLKRLGRFLDRLGPGT